MPVRQDYVHCGAILQVMNPANRQRRDLIYDRDLLPIAATLIACPFKNRRRRLGYDDVLSVVMHILQPQEAEESKEQRKWNRSPGDKMQPFAQRSHASSDCLIGVGIAIARDPLLGPGRALVSASGSYRG